jgi:hypothetical protein
MELKGQAGMRQKAEGRLQRLEARLLARKEQAQPPRVVRVVEDVDGHIIEGADFLPGGANHKPAQIIFHIVHTKKPPQDVHA